MAKSVRKEAGEDGAGLIKKTVVLTAKTASRIERVISETEWEKYRGSFSNFAVEALLQKLAREAPENES